MSKNKKYKLIGTIFAYSCIIALSLQPLTVTAISKTSASGQSVFDYKNYSTPAPKPAGQSLLLQNTKAQVKNTVSTATPQKNNVSSSKQSYLTLLNNRYSLTTSKINNNIGSSKQSYLALLNNRYSLTTSKINTNTPAKNTVSTATPQKNNVSSSKQSYLALLNNRYSLTTSKINTNTPAKNTATPSNNNVSSSKQSYLTLLNNRYSLTTSKINTNTPAKNTVSTATPQKNNVNSLKQHYLTLLNNRYSLTTSKINTNTQVKNTKPQIKNKVSTATPQKNNVNSLKQNYLTLLNNRYSLTTSNTKTKPVNKIATNVTPKNTNTTYNLKPTKIKWLKYPHKNTARNKQGNATIIWGGGSLHKLIGRLAIEGCNVDQIQIKNSNGVYRYQETGSTNNTFINKYRNFISKNTTIYISCIDNCIILKGPGQGAISQNEKCKNRDNYVTQRTPIKITKPCGYNFSNIIRTKVLNRLPIFQDTCITKYKITNNGSSKYHNARGFTYSPMKIANGKIYQNYTASIYLNQNKANTKTEVHELCHIYQAWYTQKIFMNNREISKSIGQNKSNAFAEKWYSTQMGKEFISITGQVKSKSQQKRNGYTTWSLPAYSNLKQIANNYTPHELAAEVCALYFMREINPGSRNLLTPRMIRYVEKYFVLPKT